MNLKVVIVGGVAGGATAAARVRRLDENAEIIVFEKTSFVSYANCGLPYFIGDVIQDPEELTLQSPESLWRRYRIDVRVKSEVIGVNPTEKTVTVRNLSDGSEYSETYDKLLLSPGARPIVPDLKGVGSSKVFTLRNVEDTLAIRRFVDENNPRSAVIVGGGYIGLEMAENLYHRGLKVSVVQKPDQVMGTTDRDMAAIIHSELRGKGVGLYLKTEVTGFEENGDGLRILFSDGKSVESDMVILAIGVAPDSTLAVKAGIALGVNGSIIVNDRMETSAKDIYAVGDAVQVKHQITGKNAVIALAGPANRQGRIAADNICGGDSRYKGSMGTSIIKVFDLSAACTGLTERAASMEGLDYDSIVLSPSSHASYYPDAKTMTFKLVFEKQTFRILGAQIVGYEGVDKRIDIMATAISAKMTADELKDLDLAYAPPYSSAKDPVTMAGFIADNIRKNMMKQFKWNEVPGLQKRSDITLLDTRTAHEYHSGHAEGFINIPVDEIRDNLHRLDRGKPVYVMCQSGLRSYIATRILSQNGFDCFNFCGGYRFYHSVTEDGRMAECSFPCGMDRRQEDR